MVKRVGFGLLSLGFLVACGARSLEPGDSLGPSEVRETEGDPPTAGPTPPESGRDRGPGVRFDQGDPLGACQAGFVEAEQPDEPCNCLVRGVCFDTKSQACACICPRDSSHNACVSEWDCTENSRTKVSCYAL